MQALITVPQNLLNIPLELTKINKDVYYDERNTSFYKLTLLDPLTLFISNDALTRQNIILTKYNPLYLVLNQLSAKTLTHTSQIPRYFTEEQIKTLADIEETSIKPNMNKIIEFLEKRVDAVVNKVEAQGYNKTAKKFDFIGSENPNEKKTIAAELVEILKKDIPEVYLDELIKLKYHQSKVVRAVNLDMFVEEIERDDKVTLNKKKKSTPAPKVQTIPKNQPTLFSFSSKKKE